MAQSPPRSVLITGASDGGIGAALAHEFHKHNLLVFACVRDPQKAIQLSKLPNTHILTRDVTSSASIAAAAKAVRDINQRRGIDILVNNSGVVFTMPLVDTSFEEGKKLFDVNFWGALAVIKGFTAQLVEGRGMVVHVSSVGSLVKSPTPLLGHPLFWATLKNTQL
ncbi:hypothetical protein OCU04_007505 [Sclerotinia nivalis]|uniref:Uncharacterized protein n=1 Tax=Sclerotinia nivalis TaxID=352851 RepID=A0A9X0AIW7_9HELO|nr:hypothetical protein OCU04_007505 [Sclerotinia nivalis]